MISGTIIILLAWFTNLPSACLWLAVVLTVYGGLRIMWDWVKIFIALARAGE